MNNTRNYDLCDDPSILPEVSNLYHKYQDECNKFFGSSFKQDNSGSRKYYVYGWKTLAKDEKYFYIGKGTADRWQHVTREIEYFENGKNSRYWSSSVEDFKLLKDSFGISCDKLLENLTEYEALIAEKALKLFYEEKGHYILDNDGFVACDTEEDVNSAIEEALAEHKMNFRPEPRIGGGDFIKCFFGYEPKFDSVSNGNLKKVWFYPHSFEDTDESIKRRENITTFVKTSGGKIYKSRPENNSVSIIAQGRIYRDTFINYKKDGFTVLSADDIIKYIGSL